MIAARLNGLWLTDAEVSAMQAKLLSWDFEGRAPILASVRIGRIWCWPVVHLEASRRRWPSRRMRLPIDACAKGLLTDMMAG